MTGLLLVSAFVLAGATASGPRPDPRPSSATDAASIERQCESGDSAACVELAERLAAGEGVAKDLKRAAALREQACSRGEADGCMRFGQNLVQGEGVEKDETAGRAAWKEAARLYGAACERGDLRGCTGLGGMYLFNMVDGHGEADGVALLQRACDGEEPSGCRGLGGAHNLGFGVPPDKRRAAQLYDRARDLYRKACASGNTRACWELARLSRGD